MRKLCWVVDAVLRGEATAQNFRDFAADAIRKGYPVRSDVVSAPDAVVEAEVRFIALAIPTMARHHGDARAWLTERMGKPTTMDGAFSWNIMCGGIPVAEDDDGLRAKKSAAGRFVRVNL